MYFDKGNYVATAICFSYMQTRTHIEEFNMGCSHNVVYL